MPNDCRLHSLGVNQNILVMFCAVYDNFRKHAFRVENGFIMLTREQMAWCHRRIILLKGTFKVLMCFLFLLFP